jgi:hypothetical protein
VQRSDSCPRTELLQITQSYVPSYSSHLTVTSFDLPDTPSVSDHIMCDSFRSSITFFCSSTEGEPHTFSTFFELSQAGVQEFFFF